MAENEGVPPDVPVYFDAKSWAAGRDPQLECAVHEVLTLVETKGVKPPHHPPFVDKARRAKPSGGGN